MSQLNTGTPKRSGGQIDVYTGILFVATVVLAAGCVLMAMTNMEHSGTIGADGATRDDGSIMKLMDN